MRNKDLKEIISSSKQGDIVTIVGWVKFNRNSGKICFIELNDGTTIKKIQIVAKQTVLANFEDIKTFKNGTAILVDGEFKVNANDSSQCEILASKVELLKKADESYPLQNKQHSFEFLREIAPLRVRSSTFQSIMRVRGFLSSAIHNYFSSRNYIWVASPIITANDAEGAGESFVISQDNENPFFNSNACLTVSGQLNAESYAMGLKKVYTFGPTFRAEKSNTSRHLAEFWMVEPEIAFADFNDLLNIMQDMTKSILKDVMVSCKDEMDFLLNGKDDLHFKLQQILTTDFVRLDYKDAITILKDAIKNGHIFEDSDVFFGKDLSSEHERYICEKHFNGPVFLINFPKDIKAFYMKVNDDGKTVSACDLLVPGVGEIIGGSQREDDYNKICTRCDELGVDRSCLQWYLDLRKYGYYSSVGFGLGFERFLMYITGTENIKDVIPFPRTQGELKF